MILRVLDVTTSLAATAARGWTGAFVAPLGARPEQPLELYEFEACPFCRKVREALSMLDLAVRVHPCPKGGVRFRPRVEAMGGRAQFPYLVDPNTGVRMYESRDIVQYLFDTYGNGHVPSALSLAPVANGTSMLASALRPVRGGRARASRSPTQPLELYSFEASAFCRIVRERLSELELPYLLHNVAKGSPSRPALLARSGKLSVPYLIDPNEGKALFESVDIVRFLEETYALH